MQHPAIHRIHPRKVATTSLYTKLLIVLHCLIGTTTPAFSFTLPDSGETRCYDNTSQIPCPTDRSASFYGQDANFMTAPIFIQDNGNGTVTDNNTGLIWQQHPNTTSPTWEEATASCDTLELGGQSDWRMPTRRELATATFMDRDSPSTSYLLTASNIPGKLWTATAAYRTDIAYCIYTDRALVESDYKSSSLPDGGVRCVRGGQLPAFNPSENGNTITDTTTGNIWTANSAATARSWKDALAYCATLNDGNNTDWRLPTVNELTSLLDDTAIVPALPSGFANPGKPSILWSSTTLNSNRAYALAMSVDGRVFRWSKTLTREGPMYAQTLCIRGGPSQAANLLSFQENAVTSPAAGTSLVLDGTNTVRWDSARIAGATVDLYALTDSLGQLGDNAPDAALASRLANTKFAGAVANTGSLDFKTQQLNTQGDKVKILVVSDSGSWGMTAGFLSVYVRCAAPTPLPATSVESTQFTANWEASYGATSYLLGVYDLTLKAYVPGYEYLDVGNVTSYAVTNLTQGHHYSYAVQAKEASTIVGPSTGIEVPLVQPVSPAATTLLLTDD